jgi:hypothetical protein
MKAYWVTECIENKGLICWANNGREARLICIGREELADYDFIDIRVRRCSAVDANYYGKAFADWNSKEGQETYRDAGARIEDGDRCESCGTYVFDMLEDTALNEDYLCVGCAEEK